MVNKEEALAYGKAEYSKLGSPSREKIGKKVESGERHVAPHPLPQEARYNGSNHENLL